MDVTILLCIHNGADTIPEVIRHLAQQDDAGVEWRLLVVDNASTDGSADVVARECGRFPGRFPWRVIEEPRTPKGYALERGFEEAVGRYVLVCDDDTWLAPDYMRVAVDLMDAHPRVGACHGRAVSVLAGDPPDWWERHQHNFGGAGRQVPSGDVTDSMGAFGGAGTVLRKRALDRLYESGYRLSDPGGGEDFELCFALRLMGSRLWFEERIYFEHFLTKDKTTWRGFLKRTAQNGRRTPGWRAFEEVLAGTFGAGRLPHRFYWLRKVGPSLVNGHLARVLFGLLWLRARGLTRTDRYRSLTYQWNVWLGYMTLRGRFVQMIREVVALQQRLEECETSSTVAHEATGPGARRDER